MDILRLEHVTKYLNGERVLSDVSFNVEAGSIFGYLGPNGAGKTTTIRILLGLYGNYTGTVTVAGEPLGEFDRSGIGFMLEDDGLYDHLTLIDNLKLYADIYRLDYRRVSERVDHLLTAFELRDVKGDRVRTFSHGMRQKAAFVRSILHGPRLLILDEPFNGMAPEMQHVLRELIGEKRLLIMIAVAAAIMIYPPSRIFTAIGGFEGLAKTAVDFYFIVYSLATVLLFTYAGHDSAFLTEKSNRTIHSLLSTPLDIRTVWLGKTLALFTVGYLLSLVLSFVFIAVGNSYLDAETLVTPSFYGYISIFLFNPVIAFSLIGIMGALTLLMRDEMKIRYGSLLLIFALFLFLRPGRIGIDRSLPLYQSGVSLVFAAGALLARARLRNERVILSSR